jgi:hypothetical protein
LALAACSHVIAQSVGVPQLTPPPPLPVVDPVVEAPPEPVVAPPEPAPPVLAAVEPLELLVPPPADVVVVEVVEGLPPPPHAQAQVSTARRDAPRSSALFMVGPGDKEVSLDLYPSFSAGTSVPRRVPYGDSASTSTTPMSTATLPSSTVSPTWGQWMPGTSGAS